MFRPWFDLPNVRFKALLDGPNLVLEDKQGENDPLLSSLNHQGMSICMMHTGRRTEIDYSQRAQDVPIACNQGR